MNRNDEIKNQKLKFFICTTDHVLNMWLGFTPLDEETGANEVLKEMCRLNCYDLAYAFINEQKSF